jgi:hypothetical protein
MNQDSPRNDALDCPPIQSSLSAADIDGFFRSVGDAVTLELDLSNVSPDKRPLYTEEWPKERLAIPNSPFDFIGYHVVASRRASLSNKGQRAHKGLMLFDQKPSPVNEGYIQFTFGWIEEAIVQFTIFAPSNRRATDLMKWLQNLIVKYHDLYGFFRARGIDYLVFSERLEDALEKTESQELYTRSLQFVVRVQNLLTVEAKSLESIQLNLRMKDGGEIATYSLPTESSSPNLGAE